MNVSQGVTRANRSDLFSLMVKLVAMGMSVFVGFAAPEALNTLREIRDHSVRITVLEQRYAANAVNIIEIKNDIKEIQRLILSRTAERISPEDVRRRFEANEDRIKALEKEYTR